MINVYNTQKKFIFNYFIVVNVYLFFCLIFFYFLQLYNLTFLISVSLVIHIILMVAAYNLSFNEIKIYIPPYIILISIWLYTIETPKWEHMSGGLIWFFLIPLGLRNIYPNKQSVIIKTSLLSLFIAILSLLTPGRFMIPLLPDDIGEKLLFQINLIDLTAAIFFFFFIQFYHYKIVQTRKNNPVLNISNQVDLDILTKNNQIYSRIEEYFETYKPWKNPEFYLRDLADEIGYKSTEISDAIRFYTNMNYSFFVNKYRIKAIVEELQINNEYERYNMTYLYSKAGFKNQTTFNQSFKFFMKTTPTEYIKNLGNHKVNAI